MDKLDSLHYHKFCSKSNLHKSLNTLRGIIAGIVSDGEVNIKEIEEVKTWMEEQKRYVNLHPYSELIPLLEDSFADGVLQQEELEDIEWFLDKATSENVFYDFITSDLQVLQGILHGILADGIVDEEEVKTLSNWMKYAYHLKGCYPYDEIYTLLTEVLEDGKVDEQEQEMLKAFFAEFVGLSSSNRFKLDEDLRNSITLKGVCSIDPLISFEKKKFCFTGHSLRAKRSELKAIVEKGKGIFLPNPTQKLNYLIYGAGGNQCWAYSCYGRKVERVIQLRKEGLDVQIIHENDFWDAVHDTGLNI